MKLKKNTKQAVKKKTISDFNFVALMYTISGHLFVFLFLLQNLHSSIHKGFLPLMPISIFYTAGSYVEVTPVTYIIGQWDMHIHFRGSCFERVISQQDVNKANKGMETACTEFLCTKDSSFSTFVSQVFLCDTVVFGSKTMFFCCSFHLISGYHLDVSFSCLCWYSF